MTTRQLYRLAAAALRLASWTDVHDMYIDSVADGLSIVVSATDPTACRHAVSELTTFTADAHPSSVAWGDGSDAVVILRR